MPITRTNQPKAGFNLAPSIRFDNVDPIKIPIIAAEVTESSNCQSKFT